MCFAVCACATFAATILNVSPHKAKKGENATVTLACEGTSFTTDPVSSVRLSGKLIYNAESITVLSDTELEAVFDFTAGVANDSYMAVVTSESGELYLDNAITVYDPDINGDGVLNLDDYKLYFTHYLGIMPGYAAIPELVGLSREQAEAQIAGAGFQKGIVSCETDSGTPFGTVTQQALPAGEVHSKLDSIDITVSMGFEWVQIDDPGVSGHEGFSGYMSKYETTCEQYSRFLNESLASGDIRVDNGIVYGNSGTYLNRKFIITHKTAYYSPIAFSDGVFAPRLYDGIDMSNYPASCVSWYGAMAFCEHYGLRLPTEWEWQAAADYDGTYAFGCGTTINTTLANYSGANPMGFTSVPQMSPVGYYGAYGYGLCDMAGNAFEWTSSAYVPGYRTIRGGCDALSSSYCAVGYRYARIEDITESSYGFRVVRDF